MITLMSRTYSGESIVDVSEDIDYALNDDRIPVDEYNMSKGRFVVTVEWEDDE